MNKLFYNWLTLRENKCTENLKNKCTDNSQRRRDKISNVCSTVWSALPLPGRLCLGLIIALWILSIAEALLPAYKSFIFPVIAALCFFLCVDVALFLRSLHKILFIKMGDDKNDDREQKVVELLLDNDIHSLQDFDAVIAWCDELIAQKQALLAQFTGGGTAVLTFCLGVLTTIISSLPALAVLQLTIFISLLVFGIMIAGGSTALFYIVDSATPASLTALQNFKGDLLESKLHFMRRIRY